MDKVMIAKTIAKAAHKGQKYGSKDYMHHIISVATNVYDLVKSQGDNINIDDYLAVAYLHDVVEDTNIELLDLQGIFSREIVTAVYLLTKKEKVSLYAYLDSLKKNPLALKVKIADTLANLVESHINADSKRILKYTKQLGYLIK